MDMDTSQGSLMADQTLGVLERNKQFVVSTIDLFGGVMGGVATVFSGQPLDTVKVKLQTFPAMYRNPVHCARQIYREQGIIRGLYAGTVPNLVSNIAENAVLFMAYGLCQRGVSEVVGVKNIQDLTAFQNALAGSFASFFSSIALTPAELIKCRLQAMLELKRSGQLTGPLASAKDIGPSMLVKHILRTEGIRGMFHGLQATIIREMPGYFFFFGGYEGARVLLTPKGKTKDDLGTLRLLFCGGMGGIAFWVSVFPTDVMKSRIQVSTGSSQQVQRSYMKTLTAIIREEGALALYRGLGTTLVRTFIATAALFWAYETTKQVLTDAAFGKDRRHTH